MRPYRLALLCIAITSVTLSGCAAVGQLTDTVWSETRALGQKTQQQLTLILRPAPKPVYAFDASEDADAALNMALLESLAFEASSPEVLIEDARIRFAAEVPTLRPSPASLTVVDYKETDEIRDVTDLLPIKTSYTRSYATLDTITVEALDPIPALATDALSTEDIPSMETASTPAETPSSGEDDFTLAGGPGSPELKL